MQKRIWIRSGIEEEFDVRQQRMLQLVLEKVREYYRDLYGTRAKYRYPLSLSTLARMCNRSKSTVLSAVRVLSHSCAAVDAEPLLAYDRVGSRRNRSHRPYRIFVKGEAIADLALKFSMEITSKQG